PTTARGGEMPGYPSLDPFEDMIGPVPLGGIRPRGNYGYAPYEEAAAMGQARLSTSQRLLAALSGLGAVRPGAGFGEAFLQGLGGSARNVYLAQTAAQNAAQQYAERQIEAERQRQRDDLYKKAVEADVAAKSRPAPAPKKDITNMTDDEFKAYVGREAELAKARAAGKPAPVAKAASVKAPAAPKPVAAKPPTSVERAQAGILNSVAAAEADLRNEEDRVAKLPIERQFALQKFPNAMLAEKDQKYIQSQDWWIENVLRAVSGAVINPSEYPTHRKIYFAQPGDKPGTVTQKRRSRETQQNKFRIMAGSAASLVPDGGGGGGDVDLIYNPNTGELEPAR
ncbi:MAG TPA: hypothetical protein VLA89_16460, partial [Gemmatimonadales bacterium]|nr:hypothetical protein [Gemmatimonadales bacterium]